MREFLKGLGSSFVEYFVKFVEEILRDADTEDVALLVVGDPFG